MQQPSHYGADLLTVRRLLTGGPLVDNKVIFLTQPCVIITGVRRAPSDLHSVYWPRFCISIVWDVAKCDYERPSATRIRDFNVRSPSRSSNVALTQDPIRHRLETM